MTDDTTGRRTTVRWRDTREALERLPELDGMEFLRGIQSGELPPAPFAGHVSMDLVEVENGTVTFRGTPGESHYNPIGMVHGGYLCTLLDSALGCAAHSTLPAGMGYTTIDISTSFLRPVSTDSGPLLATGRVVKPGRRVIFTEGEVVDRHGRTVATATSSLLAFPLSSD